MRKNIVINFKLQRELNRDLLAPGQVLGCTEENLLSRLLDELISWCVSPFLPASFTMVTEMLIHSICEQQAFTGDGFWVTDQIGRQHLSTWGSRPQASWESADFGCQAELLPSSILDLKLDVYILLSSETSISKRLWELWEEISPLCCLHFCLLSHTANNFSLGSSILTSYLKIQYMMLFMQVWRLLLWEFDIASWFETVRQRQR